MTVLIHFDHFSVYFSISIRPKCICIPVYCYYIFLVEEHVVTHTSRSTQLGFEDHDLPIMDGAFHVPDLETFILTTEPSGTRGNKES